MSQPSLDLDDEFEDYMRKTSHTVLATSQQYKESRRVFFAGAASVFYHMGVFSTLPEDEAVKALKQLKEQLEDFANKRVGFSD